MNPQEVFTYTPLIPSDSIYKFSCPNMSQLQEVYRQSGHIGARELATCQTLAVRGSTAALLPPNGQLTFRHKHSDIDLLALVENKPGQGQSGYLIAQPYMPDGSQTREVDILWFTPQLLDLEAKSRYRSFLTTKLIQPGWAVQNSQIYDQLKTEAMHTLLLKRFTRNPNINFITPSGAARLVLEEDLYAEPWRWTSLKTYFFESPQRNRQKAQLLHHSHQAMDKLVDQGLATKLDQPAQSEEVYKVTTQAMKTAAHHHPLIERVITSLTFVRDQMSTILPSKNGLTYENAARVLMKWRSLVLNPTLSNNLDIVFQAKKPDRK